jgi:hypothetical protein
VGTLANQNKQHLGVSTWAMEAMLADSKATGCTEGWSTEFGSPYLDCPKQGPWENSSAHHYLPNGSDPTWRSQTWFDNAKSNKIKVAMAKTARLGGVGAFTGEGAGYGKGADALWAALGSIADDTDQDSDIISSKAAKTDDDTLPTPPPPPPFSPPKASVDPDWLEQYNAANLLYADEHLDGALMPYIGNGYIATHPVGGAANGMTAAEQVATMYVSGVFNGVAVQSPCAEGYCAAPNRAKVPTYRAVLAGVPALIGRYALDLQKAALYRRRALGAELRIEERWYAHLVHRELLVHEISLNNSAGSKPRALAVESAAGSLDGSFPCVVKETAAWHTVVGAANHSERPELNRTRVAVSSNVIAPNLTLVVGPHSSKTFYFISAVATSIDSVDPHAKAQSAAIAALQDPGSLWSKHVDAWMKRWDQGRIEVGGDLRLAQATNSSLYFMLSSIRPDWPMGMSPGGLRATGTTDTRCE